jgi:hypothetical protein
VGDTIQNLQSGQAAAAQNGSPSTCLGDFGVPPGDDLVPHLVG